MAKADVVLDEATAALRRRALEALDELAEAEADRKKLELDRIELMDQAINPEVMQQLSDAGALFEAEKRAATDKYLATVSVLEASYAPRQVDIDAEFIPKLEAAQAKEANLRAEIISLVEGIGVSVKGKALHAVYTAGKKTWNTGLLEGLSLAIPQLEKCYTVGDPVVAIRGVK
jgi:hypothetical protein